MSRLLTSERTSLIERLNNWGNVYPCDLDKEEGHLYLEAARRIEADSRLLADAWELIYTGITALEEAEMRIEELEDECNKLIFDTRSPTFEESNTERTKSLFVRVEELIKDLEKEDD